MLMCAHRVSTALLCLAGPYARTRFDLTPWHLTIISSFVGVQGIWLSSESTYLRAEHDLRCSRVHSSEYCLVIEVWGKR